MAGDEVAARPVADEEGLWPRKGSSRRGMCCLDLRRTTACKAAWSLRAGHTPVSRWICAHSSRSPLPGSWRKTRSYCALQTSRHQVHLSTPGGEDQAPRQPCFSNCCSSPTRRLKTPAKHAKLAVVVHLVQAAHMEKLPLPRVSLRRLRARLGVRNPDGPAALARDGGAVPVRGCRQRKRRCSL